MKQFLITFGAVVAAMTMVLIGIPIFLFMMAAASIKPNVSGPLVVSVDLRAGLTDQSKESPFDFLTGGSGLSTIKVITRLKSASEDNNVKAVIIRLPEGGMSPAASEEIRDAVLGMKKAGKPVYAFSQGLYPDTSVIATYALGASSSELWFQPNASFQVTGMGYTDVFLKRAFDKYGITPAFEQRYEYKNAVNSYTQSDFTPAHREATLGYLGGIYNNMIATIAVDRKSTPDKIKQALESGPFGPDKAKQLGLISEIGQLTDLEEKAKKLGGDDTKIVDISAYKSSHKSSGSGDNLVAVISGEGAILTGGGNDDPFSSESLMGSDEIAGAFAQATKDEHVKAIVFRVSSPGGSDTASEQIADAVSKAQKAGKPVVISMGNYAASGGYWISAGADKIVSNPSTLTGSIGVYGGKMAIGEAASRFGVDFRDIGVGSEYAQAYTPAKDFTPTQKAAISGWIDGIYQSFITRVAKGRKLSVEQVHEIAKGRVWTGSQALERKLVDKTGGYFTAITEAKALAKLGDAKVKVVNYSSDNGSPFGATSKMWASLKAGLKALSFLGWAMSDPKAEMFIDKVSYERTRAQGNVVLADHAIVAVAE